VMDSAPAQTVPAVPAQTPPTSDSKSRDIPK
jgi:hypothetical protein